jgi:hypothetical protein
VPVIPINLLQNIISIVKNAAIQGYFPDWSSTLIRGESVKNWQTGIKNSLLGVVAL